MRRIGETCTAAQTRIHCNDIVTEEYDQNGGNIRWRRRVPVGMASFASERPIARVAGSGSAKLRLLTCVRRQHHAISAEYARFYPPRERQAPIIQLATKHSDPRQDRRQPGGETGQKGCDDTRRLGRRCMGSRSSPCSHLTAAASVSPQLEVARPYHRRPHARAPYTLPS